MAGLSCAHELASMADVVVLERESWLGGRMHSERLAPDGPWGNFGAQMITADRVNVVRLARAVGCSLTTVKWAHVLDRARLTFQGMHVGTGDQEVLRQTIERLEDEQSRRRDPALSELDDRSFADWLGDLPATVRDFWEEWSQGLANARTEEISLYAAMCLWGDQRVSPWRDAKLARHDLGDCVVDGGTGELGRLLGESLRDRCVTTFEVLECRPGAAGYVINGTQGGVERDFEATNVVCALPAPEALEVLPWLPEWKRAALASVSYGRFLVTPIWVGPAGQCSEFVTAEAHRDGVTYALPAFPLRTSADPDEHGACYQSWVNDGDAQEIWEDSDESIRSGVRAAFLRRFPEYAERIVGIGVKRWRFGLPKFAPGRVKTAPLLVAPVDALHFCGDYLGIANLEQASLSGRDAARAVLGVSPVESIIGYAGASPL